MRINDYIKNNNNHVKGTADKLKEKNKESKIRRMEMTIPAEVVEGNARLEESERREREESD